MTWLQQHDGGSLTSVAIAPDLGERYLDTVYRKAWLQKTYGKDVLDDPEAYDGPLHVDPQKVQGAAGNGHPAR